MTIEAHSNNCKYVNRKKLKQKNIHKLNQNNIHRSVDNPEFFNFA